MGFINRKFTLFCMFFPGHVNINLKLAACIILFCWKLDITHIILASK